MLLPDAPRLACVKPVASVHPEPGSNSSLLKLFMSLLKIPSFLQVQVLLTVFILNTCTTVVYVIFSKNSSQSVSCETWCKGKDFYFYLPNFFEVFSIYFFGRQPGGYRISAWILPTSSSFLSGSLTPSPSCRLSHLSRLRVQKYCFITYPPNVFATFFQLFFAFPDCQGVMNTLFPSVLLNQTPSSP